MQDVSDRLRHLPSARRTLIVISPDAELKNRACRLLSRQVGCYTATHALQISLRRERDDFIAEGSD